MHSSPPPAPDAKPSRRYVRLLKLGLLITLPTALLVTAAEIVASYSITRRVTVAVDSTTGRATYSMRIGKWPWSRASVTPLNSLRYPDDEFPPVGAKSDCLHVVFSGDSFVYGDGVDRDSSFFQLVRRETTRRVPERCVRMFNIGVRGTTIDRQAEAIEKTMDRLKPDIVVLVQYQNDLIDLNAAGAILDPNRDQRRSDRAPDSVRVRMRIFDLDLIKMLTYQSFGFMIRNDINRDVLRHWSVLANPDRAAEARLFQDTYARLYGELVQSLEARNVAFGVVIIPSKFDLLAKRFPEESFFLDLARQHGVPALRLFPVFDAQRKPYTFLMYDGHLNAHGNRLVATEVNRWLFESEPAPFPQLRAQPRSASRIRAAPTSN